MNCQRREDMNRFKFWKNGALCSLTTEDNTVLLRHFVKLVCVEGNLFLLDSLKGVWKGEVTDENIKLTKTKISAIDLARSKSNLYYVNEFGKVFKTDHTLEEQEEIVLHEDASNCIHGYSTSSHRTFVKRIIGNSSGLLFVSDNGKLWGSGLHPALGINSSQPKKIQFFDGRVVVDLDCGEDIYVVIAQKKEEVCLGTKMGSGDDVFLTMCQQCSNEVDLTPLTPQSNSDTCSLGLRFKKSTESLSASTTTSKNTNSNNKANSNENSSSCSEGDSPHLSDTSECSMANMFPEDKIEYEKVQRAAGNMLLINTEAARQFLTRQLSWVSTGGEELFAEVSLPTRIIRRNVTTMASIVYEGVKTVGDKVATLSRHVSGGSDINSESFEEFEELNKSNASITGSCRWEWSGSDHSEEVLLDKNQNCLSQGSRLIRTEIWSWGNAQQGQLGSGDNFRTKLSQIPSVSHIGVSQVWCGRSHCLVQTLDGRVFGWGSNAFSQLSDDPSVDFISLPTVIGKGLSAATGSAHSVIVNRSREGSLCWLAKSKISPTSFNKIDEEEEDCSLVPFSVVASEEFSCIMYCAPAKEATIETDLAHEQCVLEELITIQTYLVKPLTFRRSTVEDTISSLCSRFTDVLHLSAVLVATLLDGKPSYEVLTQYQDDIIHVYEAYMNTMCDVIATNGFSQIVKSVEIPPKITSCFADRLPSRKTSPESIMACAFSQPLSYISVYKGMLSRGGEHKRMEKFLDLQEVKRKEAELTRAFWDSSGSRLPDNLRAPQRRLIKESRSSPLALHSASRFSSHWFVLMSDVFVHVSNGHIQVHNLSTLWLETNGDSDTVVNSLNVITPEETMILFTPGPNEKSEWLQAFQSAIKTHLNKLTPSARIASYVFAKPPYKEAKYTGRWLMGKMEGLGKLEWPDGSVYVGEFHNNQYHGFGRLELPDISTYEGQWRDGVQNGHGVTKFKNGDMYNGYYKEGLECGHGMRKNGKFSSGQASIYVGEWLLGQRHGYGVLNNLSNGEKYLGVWSGNLRNGSGLCVTLDGIYYEGTFTQDVLTGRGIMVLDDGTHYDGELKEVGVFCGKGTLTFRNGDTFEGVLNGSYSEGIKINGTFHRRLSITSPVTSPSKPESIGSLSVDADLKWKSVFKQCCSTLGISSDFKAGDCQKAWENIAVILSYKNGVRHHETLQTIPSFGRVDLDLTSYRQIVSYLVQAFESIHHPIGRAFSELVEAYTTTYGGVLVHPLLLPQAVAEMRSITVRLYQIVRVLFPALPVPTTDINVFSNDEEEVITMCGLLHPIILPKLYSSLFILYSLHNQSENDTYWKRLLKWNRHPDSTLLAFLGVDKKFWVCEDSTLNSEGLFSEAIMTLQQLKTTFSPIEKLLVIHSTFKAITKIVHQKLGDSFVWQMDDLFPVFHYVVVRSHVLELGSEIHFIEDFIENRFKQGEMDIMFTTLKASFIQILQEKSNVVS